MRSSRVRETRVDGGVIAPQKARNPSVPVRQAEPMWGRGFILPPAFWPAFFALPRAAGRKAGGQGPTCS